MIKIEAIIQPNRFDLVKKALIDIGVEGIEQDAHVRMIDLFHQLHRVRRRIQEVRLEPVERLDRDGPSRHAPHH